MALYNGFNDLKELAYENNQYISSKIGRRVVICKENYNTDEIRIIRQVNKVEDKFVISEPKTRSSVRTIALPAPVLKMLRQYKESAKIRVDVSVTNLSRRAKRNLRLQKEIISDIRTRKL